MTFLEARILAAQIMRNKGWFAQPAKVEGALTPGLRGHTTYRVRCCRYLGEQTTWLYVDSLVEWERLLSMVGGPQQ